MRCSEFIEYLSLNKISLKEYEERLNEQLALTEKERIRLKTVLAMNKIIYTCETVDKFKKLCSVFDYPTDVHIQSSEPVGLRVEYGKAMGHNNLSWYKWGDQYKDYKFIECFEDVKDDIKSPFHYRLEGLDIESKHVIKEILGKEGYKNWCRGTALKYLLRAGKKEDELKDFKKAKEYISWIIKEMEAQNEFTAR